MFVRLFFFVVDVFIHVVVGREVTPDHECFRLKTCLIMLGGWVFLQSPTGHGSWIQVAPPMLPPPPPVPPPVLVPELSLPPPPPLPTPSGATVKDTSSGLMPKAEPPSGATVENTSSGLMPKAEPPWKKR